MRVVYFKGPATGYEWGAPMNASGAGGHGWAPMNRIACATDGDGGDGCVCARVFTRACARVRVCMRAHACAACVYAHMRVCMRDVFAIYDKIFDPG